MTSSFIASYSNLKDGAIITGFLLTQYLASAGSTTFSIEYLAISSSPYDRPSGYIVCQNPGIQIIFFSGAINTAFTRAQLEYDNAIKQPVSIGKLASAF